MSHSSDLASSDQNTPEDDDTSGIKFPLVTDEMLREGLIDSVTEALGRPGQGPVGFNSSGLLVERIRDPEYSIEDCDGFRIQRGMRYDEILLLRSRCQILEEYEYHWKLIWWYRSRDVLSGRCTNPELRDVYKAFREIQKHHGGRAKLLERSESEWSVDFGYMQALAWVLGKEWHNNEDS